MNRRQRWAWFLAILVVSLLMMPPLQLLASRFAADGLTAREVVGSVWRGRLRGAAWRGVEFGELRLHLQPFSLLAGTRALRANGDSLSLRLLQGRRNGVDGMHGRIALGEARLMAGLQAEAEFDGFALVFEDGRCMHAAGRSQLRLAPPGGNREVVLLAGAPTCADRVGLVELRSQGGSSRIEASLRIEADGGYRLQALVGDADPVLVQVLRQNGFQESPGGYSRSIDGSLAH